MVRLEYGFNGYQVPTIPRASRSARGKRSFRKKSEVNQMCAFDLLATVAGELLLLKERVPPSIVSPGRAQFVTAKDTIKQEQQNEEKPFKHDRDQGSCDESASGAKVVSHMHVADYVLKDNSHSQDGVTLPLTSTKAKFESLERVACADESIIVKNKYESMHRKCHTESGSSGFDKCPNSKVDDQIEKQLEVGQQRTGCTVHRTKPDIPSSMDPIELDVKPPALVSSDSSIEVPLCGDHISSGLFIRCQDDTKVVSRDDDENSCGCTQPSTISLKAYRPPHIGDRRIRKTLASKFWEVAPMLLKDGELSNSDLERKPVFRNRESCYTRRRTQRCSPFKRRKLFERSSISTSEGGISSEGASNSPGKDGKEAVGSGATVHGGNRALSPAAGQESPFKSEDSRVKLSIKSFRVPELFIEIPETATVGSLKRTVVEAVSAILGGGLQISILLQGKKVRDDNKTLLQTGIAHDDKLDTLGFMLEPNPAHAPSLCPEDHCHLLLPCDATQPPNRYSVVPTSDPVVPDVSPHSPLANAGNCIESDHNSVPSPSEMSSEKSASNSRALVSIPTMSLEALAVVPSPRKSRRSELAQRRIRRPFSVSEVEALVQAVEKLGTGRWRDVKLRAFETEKHRTYVDLKDKWKTLVHTARISPQQRRGEPVPQELLDRVLSAHAYWSQQQVKQHVKPQSEPCLLL